MPSQIVVFAVLLIIGVAGFVTLLSTALFPQGFKTRFRRVFAGSCSLAVCIGILFALPDIPSREQVIKERFRSAIAERELDFERALSRLPVAITDIMSEKHYQTAVGLAELRVVEQVAVDGKSAPSSIAWSGRVTSLALPLVSFESGGGVSQRPSFNANIIKENGRQFPIAIELQPGRDFQTSAGLLRTWTVTVPSPAEISINELVTVTLTERASTEEIASTLWFDPRDYPPSLTSYTACVSPVRQAVPYAWSDEIVKLTFGSSQAGVSAIWEGSNKACLTAALTENKLSPFIVLFLQERDAVLAAINTGGS